MTDNVVALKGGEINNPLRNRFIQAVAATFDIFVEHNGYEPEAIVYVLGGITQNTVTAYDMTGVSGMGITSMLALAATHLASEASSSRLPLDDE